jgi:hypothetical protein
MRVVFADRAAQHRIFVFDRIDNCTRRHGAVNIDMHLIADLSERSQMMWKNDTDHDYFFGGGGGGIELCRAANIHFPFCFT